jgi:hypothetical protein
MTEDSVLPWREGKGTIPSCAFWSLLFCLPFEHSSLLLPGSAIRETEFPRFTFKSHWEIETWVQIVHNLWGHMRLSALCVWSFQVHHFRENKVSIKDNVISKVLESCCLSQILIRWTWLPGAPQSSMEWLRMIINAYQQYSCDVQDKGEVRERAAISPLMWLSCAAPKSWPMSLLTFVVLPEIWVLFPTAVNML